MSDNNLEMLQPNEIERQLEVLPVEINIIDLVKEYIGSLEERNKESIEFFESNMVENMVRYTKDWQFMGDSKPGLNSGSVGKAMAHMVGAGILKEFPVLRKCNKKDYMKKPVVVEKEPSNEVGDCIFELNLILRNGEDNYYAGYLFDTSKQLVSNRLQYLRNQRSLFQDVNSQQINNKS